MNLVLWAVSILIASAAAAGVSRKASRVATWAGAGGAIFSSVLGIMGSVHCLVWQMNETRIQSWNAPYASFTLGLDGLSALFLVPVFFVGGLSALAGLGKSERGAGAHWFFHNVLLAAISLVVVSRNGVLFLLAWEAMTLCGFFLITFSTNDPEAKRGGWVYLVSGHIGGACLFALFALMGIDSPKMDFSRMSVAASSVAPTVAFVLAFVGFGLKSGIFPFHSWYPESYPAAPGRICAILSGAMANMGIYGLLRSLTIITATEKPPFWWGCAIMICGLASAFLGALRALAEKDMKRILAWSTVENMGIITTAIGLGLVGIALGDPVLAKLSFTAAALHTACHSAAKSLLFLTAQTVERRLGDRQIDRMGGIMKVMPVTGSLFFIGALGAACVPPLSGFAGEFLIFYASFTSVAAAKVTWSAGLILAAIAVLALASGITVAAYARVFGGVFLGAGRYPSQLKTGEDNTVFPASLAALAVVGLGVGSAWAATYAGQVGERLARMGAAGFTAEAVRDGDPHQLLVNVSAAFAALIILSAALALGRKFLLRGRRVEAGPTWDCGYSAPTARMQYTPSSFANPLATTFSNFAGIRDRLTGPDGLFPRTARFSSSLPDVSQTWPIVHLFRLFARAATRLRRFQAGRVQLYLLYLAAALVAVLLWKLR